MIRVPLVIVVNPSLPARSVAEFIAYAKAHPGKINMASGGPGGPDHMSGELFKMMTGVNMTHVPYRGLSPALNDLLGGQVQVVFSTFPSSIEYIKAGSLRALAVRAQRALQPRRISRPSPTPCRAMKRAQWYGIGAPRNTPADIVETLNRAINAALADPTMRTRFSDLGGAVLAGSPADFGKLIADETAKWAKAVKFAGVPRADLETVISVAFDAVYVEDQSPEPQPRQG